MHNTSILYSLLCRYKNNKAIAAIESELNRSRPLKNGPLTLVQLLALYEKTIELFEPLIWKWGFNEQILLEYQSLCREMEVHFSNLDKDSRHQFIIIIPIADRPQHLENCLSSILDLCECFAYGGKNNRVIKKISVIVSDDSRYKKNIEKHKLLAIDYTGKGLITEYFGISQQIQKLEKLEPQLKKSIIGGLDKTRFYHKGASTMRNITYLRLSEMDHTDGNVLYYFIDSDQEFKQNILNQPDKKHLGINYFYHLDRAFSETNIEIMTGKVVGDPPVSPAVMAHTCLKDVSAFIDKIASSNPDQPCQFHAKHKLNDQNARYHDMANLFGFNPQQDHHYYQCPLTRPHTNADGLIHFASQLSLFFDGVHPTRFQVYEFQDVKKSITPARTVYTGNYIFKPEMLSYFIPFAPLKLRMAGPVLGRLLKFKLGEKFSTINLPMLHTRTIVKAGQSEFRTGIEHCDSKIDISDEFVRQFFGDVMLFTIIELTEKRYPDKYLNQDMISRIITTTTKNILVEYKQQHSNIILQLSQLTKRINNKSYWWHRRAELRSTQTQLSLFAQNMALNFDTNALTYQQIGNKDVQAQYSLAILEEISNYPLLTAQWKAGMFEATMDKT